MEFLTTIGTNSRSQIAHKMTAPEPTKRFELEQRTFRDGHIVLYKRPNLKNPKWQCRISVPNATGYIRRTTHYSDEFEARRFAEELYEELRTQVRSGGALRKPKFDGVFAQFKQRYRNEAASERRYNEVIDTVERYGLPFFKIGHLRASITLRCRSSWIGDETMVSEGSLQQQRSTRI
jgi:hypothetical protein